jgi:hypothetical protein
MKSKMDNNFKFKENKFLNPKSLTNKCIFGILIISIIAFYVMSVFIIFN